MEYDQLALSYSIERPYMVIPNGIDTDIFKKYEERKKDKKMVLCVARTEGLKNQLTLIKALNNSAFQLYIIGNPSVNQKGYFNQCRKAAAPNIHFIGHVPQEQLIQ
jgi:glycosyltransferase involved in cell wall biosynthesis